LETSYIRCKYFSLFGVIEMESTKKKKKFDENGKLKPVRKKKEIDEEQFLKLLNGHLFTIV